MIKWEYLIVPMEGPGVTGFDGLDHYGSAGWELVQIIKDKLYVVAYFKRAKQAPWPRQNAED